MTSPPGTQPTPSTTSVRNQDDAASAAWKARRAKRIRAAAQESFAEAQRVPRKRKLSAADTRIGGPVWRLRS